MCYSALVEQNAKKIGLRFQARVQTELYADLFARRLAGEKLLINKAMERQFTQQAETPAEKAIAANIRAWHRQLIPELEQELFAQKKRLADANRALAMKVTKKAENDRRVAAKKIEKIKIDLEKHHSEDICSETEERIFPLHFLSLLAVDKNGEKVVLPARYLMRPHDKGPDFDTRFGGCYNARLDSLDTVAWWKKSLVSRRGLILVKKFYENVSTEDYLKKFHLPEPQSAAKSTVICFEPEGQQLMLIPTVWDEWRGSGNQRLISTALITDDPAPEVAETGHDRTPIFLKENAVEDWLRAPAKGLKDLIGILGQREHPHYSHRVVGAA